MTEALRPKLVKRLASMMVTIEHVAGSVSGQVAHSSAGRIADAVLSETRAHDEDYARTLPLAGQFRRLPVEIKVNEATAPFAEGCMTEESAAMLCAMAEREFAARQRAGESDPWAGDGVVDAHICCEHEHLHEDPELSLMAEILRGMNTLSPDARQRIRNWVDERFARTR